jgi:cytochrome b6-f complex iron-sulfur subunit
MYTPTDLRSGQLDPERRDFLRKAGAITALTAFGIGFFTACSEEDNPGPGAGTGMPPPPAAGITVTDTAVTIDLNQQSGLQISGVGCSYSRPRCW